MAWPRIQQRLFRNPFEQIQAIQERENCCFAHHEPQPPLPVNRKSRITRNPEQETLKTAYGCLRVEDRSILGAVGLNNSERVSGSIIARKYKETLLHFIPIPILTPFPSTLTQCSRSTLPLVSPGGPASQLHERGHVHLLCTSY